jgi:hypothetical protein
MTSGDFKPKNGDGSKPSHLLSQRPPVPGRPGSPVGAGRSLIAAPFCAGTSGDFKPKNGDGSKPSHLLSQRPVAAPGRAGSPVGAGRSGGAQAPFPITAPCCAGTSCGFETTNGDGSRPPDPCWLLRDGDGLRPPDPSSLVTGRDPPIHFLQRHAAVPGCARTVDVGCAVSAFHDIFKDADTAAVEPERKPSLPLALSSALATSPPS